MLLNTKKHDMFASDVLMIVSRKGFFFSLFVSIVAVAPSIERCCKTKTLSIWTISNTKRSTIPVFLSPVSLILVVTFPEGGFASSLFTADRCLFSQNRSFSNQDRQIEQIHRQCTARLQTVSSAPHLFANERVQPPQRTFCEVQILRKTSK